MISCKRDTEGSRIGKDNAQLVLDTRRYVVEFSDGDITELTINMIAELMYEQVDLEGNYTLLMDYLVYYRRN